MRSTIFGLALAGLAALPSVAVAESAADRLNRLAAKILPDRYTDPTGKTFYSDNSQVTYQNCGPDEAGHEVVIATQTADGSRVVKTYSETALLDQVQDNSATC